MRDIKFRVWDKKYKKMRLLNSIVFDSNKNVKLINAWGRDIIEDKDIIVHRENNYELMQYTGLKDKNGKEIYEGDIVEYEDEVNGVWAEYFGIPIIYSNEYAMFCFKDDEGNLLSIYRNLKIIGNIYEDKHLLEG